MRGGIAALHSSHRLAVSAFEPRLLYESMHPSAGGLSAAREWRTMRRILFLTLALMCYAAVTSAQSMGTLTENGVVMEVKAAVGVLDNGRLTLFLLPFQPTAAEIAKLQTDDSLWILGKPTPDAKKWKSTPFGRFRLDWRGTPQAIGDAQKAGVYIMTNGIVAEGTASNINKLPGEVAVALVGVVKDGQEVTVTSKGSDKMTTTTVAWDLKLKAKVLTLK
jgi:hypothetical protein